LLRGMRILANVVHRGKKIREALPKTLKKALLSPSICKYI